MKNINNQSQSLDKIAGLEDLNHENAAVCSGGWITLYDGADLKGPSVSFIVSVPDLRPFNFNDRASSVRVTVGEKWQLFLDFNYRGLSVVFGTGSFNLLGVFDNNVSSIKRLL